MLETLCGYVLISIKEIFSLKAHMLYMVTNTTIRLYTLNDIFVLEGCLNHCVCGYWCMFVLLPMKSEPTIKRHFALLGFSLIWKPLPCSVMSVLLRFSHSRLGSILVTSTHVFSITCKTVVIKHAQKLQYKQQSTEYLSTNYVNSTSLAKIQVF